MMNNLLNRLKKRLTPLRPRQGRNHGQGIVEYVIILSVAGLLIIFLANVLEPQIGTVFSRLVERAPVAPPDLLAFTPPPTSTIDPNAPTATQTPTPADTSTPTATSVPNIDVRINFQPAAVSVPSGYFVDDGSLYGLNTDNGYTYGWNINMTGRTRDRNNGASPGQEYDTLNHLSVSGSGPAATWNFELPSSNYEIRLVAGDPQEYPRDFKIDVEGFVLVDGQNSSSDRWFDVTAVIQVTDGNLTISAADNVYSSKINFIHIKATSDSPLPTPTNTPSPTPTNTATPEPAGLVKINFQPAAAAIPSGYIVDDGSVYGDRGNGYTYGWNADTTGRMRDRNDGSSLDQRYDTFNHMFQSSTLYTWEMARPNGCYEVFITGGDPLSASHPREYHMVVEGITAFDGATAANPSTARWLDATITVNVTDGNLTVNTTSGHFTKINFIHVTGVTCL